jgi:ArsR family transcriptional regulator, arsenate/arsenite/antimonite-responsive transcriptional repressor
MTSAETDELMRALADPMRARIVELLAAEQLCTCHLVELTGARQTNISNHLRVLREAGLVESRPAGRYTFYRLRPEALAALAGHYAALAERARGAAQAQHLIAGEGEETVNCFDCAARGRAAEAVAICADCGAGVCLEHAQVTPRWLARTVPVNRTVPVEPPARTIRCGLCQQARDAAAGQPSRPAARRERL